MMLEERVTWRPSTVAVALWAVLHVWCMCGACMVHVWCMYGAACMVQTHHNRHSAHKPSFVSGAVTSHLHASMVLYVKTEQYTICVYVYMLQCICIYMPHALCAHGA